MVLSSWISPIKKLWLPTLLSFSTSYGESNQLGRPGPVLVVLIERAGNNKPRLKHKGKKYQQNTLNPNHSEIKGVTPVLNGKSEKDIDKLHVDYLSHSNRTSSSSVPSLKGIISHKIDEQDNADVDAVLMVTPRAIERYLLDGELIKRTVPPDTITCCMPSFIPGIGRVLICGTQLGHLYIFDTVFFEAKLIFDPACIELDFLNNVTSLYTTNIALNPPFIRNPNGSWKCQSTSIYTNPPIFLSSILMYYYKELLRQELDFLEDTKAPQAHKETVDQDEEIQKNLENAIRSCFPYFAQIREMFLCNNTFNCYSTCTGGGLSAEFLQANCNVFQRELSSLLNLLKSEKMSAIARKNGFSYQPASPSICISVSSSLRNVEKEKNNVQNHIIHSENVPKLNRETCVNNHKYDVIPLNNKGQTKTCHTLCKRDDVLQCETEEAKKDDPLQRETEETKKDDPLQCEREEAKKDDPLQCEREEAKKDDPLQCGREEAKNDNPLHCEREELKKGNPLQCERKETKNDNPLQCEREELKKDDPLQCERKEAKNDNPFRCEGEELKKHNPLQCERKETKNDNPLQCEREELKKDNPLQCERKEAKENDPLQCERKEAKNDNPFRCEREGPKRDNPLQCEREEAKNDNPFLCEREEPKKDDPFLCEPEEPKKDNPLQCEQDEPKKGNSLQCEQEEVMKDDPKLCKSSKSNAMFKKKEKFTTRNTVVENCSKHKNENYNVIKDFEMYVNSRYEICRVHVTCSFGSFGTTLIAGDSRGRIFIWSVPSGCLQQVLYCPVFFKDDVLKYNNIPANLTESWHTDWYQTKIHVSALLGIYLEKGEHHLWASFGNGIIAVYNLNTGDCIHVLNDLAEIRLFELLSRMSLILSLNESFMITAWDGCTFERLLTLSHSELTNGTPITCSKAFEAEASVHGLPQATLILGCVNGSIYVHRLFWEELHSQHMNYSNKLSIQATPFTKALSAPIHSTYETVTQRSENVTSTKKSSEKRRLCSTLLQSFIRDMEPCCPVSSLWVDTSLDVLLVGDASGIVATLSPIVKLKIESFA